MGNLGSSIDDANETLGRSRAERWALAKRCVALLQVSFPEASLESVLLLPRETLLRCGRLPTYKEGQASLRPITSLAVDKKHPTGVGKILYLSHLVGGMVERRWVPGASSYVCIEDPAKAGEAAANAAGGAVAVAVAAAAVGAAQAAAGAAIAKRASAAGEASDLYATARAFLLENTEFQYIWVASACLPPRLRENKSCGAVPGVNGSNIFDHLHPGALLACDAMLVTPPERESMAWCPQQRERYTDLEMYSLSPWKTLEGAVAQLMDTVTYYAFRLGDALVFSGPHGPACPAEPPPSPLDYSRRSSAPSSVAGSEGSPGGKSLISESPISLRAAASGAAKALLNRGSKMGWHNKHSHREFDDSRWNGGEWDLGTGRSTGSVTTGSVSGSSSAGSRRRGDSGMDGSRLERAVNDALDQLGINGSGTPPERNWRGVTRPCYLLRKARQDVEKYSDARGALKQAMCSMSVSKDQAEEFFGVWRHLGTMGPSAAADRLATLNMLVFAVSLADGHCCPRRSRDFVGQVIEESLVNAGHLDLWMKDLSPDDSRDILKSVNLSGKKLRTLTIGSSHTAGAGVGSFLRGHSTLKELELEWEGVRDVTSIAKSLADHQSLTRLNLTHNEVGPRGASQLADALRMNGSLTELDLRENSLGPKGMKAIAGALAKNDTVQILHLQDNNIGDDGVIAMTEALMRNGRLRNVCLDGNKVTDVGAKVICIAIKMNLALKLLSLSRNALSDDWKRALRDAWAHREVEEGQHQSGMFLEQAAEGTKPGRGRWASGRPPVEGVLVSTRADEDDIQAGVLVSPTRDEQCGDEASSATFPDRGGGFEQGGHRSRGGSGGSGALMPRFSPVSDNFVRKPLW